MKARAPRRGSLHGARLAILVVAALASGTLVFAQDYRAALGPAYEKALDHAFAHATAWREELGKYGADIEALIPVIFPELVRYSLFRDELETAGLAGLYVPGGAGAADFSIGRFQMKPSFAERVEEGLAAEDPVPSAFASLAAFAGGQDGTHGRAMRIDRLRDERWQLCYLAAFAHLVETRLPLGGLDTADKVVFLAAAYNRGFWLPREEIERSKTWRLFPARLPVFGQGPFGYADVAVDFYERYWREMILTSLWT